MIKFLLYTILFTVGGYVVVTRLPDSYKEKMLAAIGWGEIKGKSFSIFNPAAQREDLLNKLDENLVKVEELQKASAGKNESTGSRQPSPKVSGKSIVIEGAPIPPGQLAPLIKEQKEIIEQLKDLNPQTGVLPKVMSKILGLDSPPAITPELKAEICGVK